MSIGEKRFKVTGSPKILLVDDEKRLLKTFAKLLKREGYEVHSAPESQEALAVLEANKIDVVVLDIKMPGMDGLGLLETIKHTWPEISVIMLTGHATVDSALAGLRQGAFDFLVKPCPLETLMEKIEFALERKSCRNQT
jgi:DNA-binding NtrC family response regulator